MTNNYQPIHAAASALGAGDETGRAVTAEFSAPSAGPPPCFVYRLSLHSGTALQTIAPAPTRWRF